MSAQPIPFASVPKPVPDLEEIKRASLVIIGRGKGRVIEIRALKTKKGTVSGYYDNSTFIQDVFDISSREGVPAVYWTIQNVRRDAVTAMNTWAGNVSKTTDDDQIDRYVWLPIDCDPVRPAGTSSTDAEKSAALDVAHEIRDMLLIRGIESILADSGNGYHVLPAIDLPVTDGNKELVKSLLRVLALKFDTDAVHVDTGVANPSRILKIYGTVARKGEHTDERPWRTARLVEVPESLPVVPETELRKLLADITAELPAEKVAEAKRKKAADPNRKEPVTKDRNLYLTSVAGTWQEKGFSDEGIREELHRLNEEICNPPLDEWEVDQIADNVCRYEKGDPIQDSPASFIVNKEPSAPNLLAGVARVEEAKPFEWGTPEEITDALLPVLPFSLEYLPFCLRGWAQDVSERMSIPLDFTGVSIIVALAGAIGRRVFVYPKNDKSWKEAVCISGAVCASSGKLKTPTFKIFMAPFQQLEMEWNAAYKTAVAAYMEAQKAYELRYRTAVKMKVGETFDEEPPEEPKEPRRIILNDSTPEKAHSIMAKNPAGILLYRDEFASWVAELEKEGRESQRGLYLAAMNGNDMHSVDRVGRGSTNAIMCASLFGGFQPEMLRDFLGDARNIHDGMLARFGGLVWPDDVWMPPIDRAESRGDKDLYNHIIRKLAVMEAESVDLHFAPDAQARFNAWRVAHMERVAKVEHVGKQSHLSKYHGLLPKLAGLLMMADLVALALKSPGVAVVNLDKGTTETKVGDTAGLAGRHMIDLAHLEQAIGLLAYFESHMERVYACAKSPEQRALHALAEHIRQGDLRGTFRLRDVRRKHWADLGETRLIECAADVLVERGWAREMEAEKNTTGGRPTERWEISPKARKK